MKGEYRHTIDAKGRLFVPAKLREELGAVMTVTKGLDGCLFVYSEKDWNVLEDRIRQLPISQSRDLQRFFISSAVDCEPDTQGRILVSANLRQHAGLSKDVVIIGVSGRCEIWDAAKWDEYNSRITPESIESAMETLGF